MESSQYVFCQFRCSELLCPKSLNLITSNFTNVINSHKWVTQEKIPLNKKPSQTKLNNKCWVTLHTDQCPPLSKLRCKGGRKIVKKRRLMPPRTRCLPDTTGLTDELTETVAACTGPEQAQARVQAMKEGSRHQFPKQDSISSGIYLQRKRSFLYWVY